MAFMVPKIPPVAVAPTGGQGLTLDPFGKIPASLLPVYTTYTPTWTSTGTAPAIGDSTVTARWTQIGKKVHCYGFITFGASATFGTGSYRFALPVAANTANNGSLMGSFYLYDQSAGALGFGVGSWISSTTLSVIYGATYLGAVTAIGQTSPWTWASPDQIGWNITYEAA